MSPNDLKENLFTHKCRAEDTGESGAILSECDIQPPKGDAGTSAVPTDNLDTTVSSQLARARLVYEPST